MMAISLQEYYKLSESLLKTSVILASKQHFL